MRRARFRVDGVRRRPLEAALHQLLQSCFWIRFGAVVGMSEVLARHESARGGESFCKEYGADNSLRGGGKNRRPSLAVRSRFAFAEQEERPHIPPLRGCSERRPGDQSGPAARQFAFRLCRMPPKEIVRDGRADDRIAKKF